ncbi:24111_t:CDS:10, partial [Gigaspora margarita]
PSDLTEDSLPRDDEILKPSVTQSNHPRKEKNLSHSDIINAETSVIESHKNDMLVISSIIDNQREPPTSSSSINEQNQSDKLMDYQIMNIIRQYQPVVLVNDPILESQKYNDPQPDSDSSEEIREQGDLVRKRKSEITQKYKASKKAKKNDSKDKQSLLETHGDTNITTEHNEQANNKSSNLESTFVNSTNSEFNDNEDSKSTNSEQQIEIEQVTKSKYSKSKVTKYVDLLKKIRRVKRISENFASQDPSKIFEMFSQPIDRHFNEGVSEVSFEPEPIPKIMEDVYSCSKYLKIWDSHFNNCKNLIGIQDYKMLRLTYSLTEVFFIMLKICNQEQVKDTSLAKNTNTWKGRDIKSRMNKFWNINSRTMLKKWTSYWRLCHFLWVTNISPKEMVEVKLKADFFRNVTDMEYNFLIKELLEQDFPNFSNIKDEKILDLIEIAKKICK